MANDRVIFGNRKHAPLNFKEAVCPRRDCAKEMKKGDDVVLQSMHKRPKPGSEFRPYVGTTIFCSDECVKTAEANNLIGKPW